MRFGTVLRCVQLASAGMLVSGAVSGCDPELPFGRLRDVTSPDAGSDGAALPLPFSCTQRGPLYALDDGALSACGSDARGFHHALCACEELVNGGDTEVDGFDSRAAAYAPGQRSGSLATSRGLFLAKARIGGSVVISGSGGTPLTGDLEVGGNLLDQGPLQGEWSVSVDGRAEVAGDVRLDALRVDGPFTLAEGAALEVQSGAPAVTRGPVSIAPACSCEGALELAPLLDAARIDNDNASIGLEPASSLKLFEGAREVPLPCGRYYVSDLYAAAPLSLRIRGRVALYVDSGIVIEPSGSLTITLEGDAELDLFVRRGVSSAGPVEIGNDRTPTRTRLYFGATTDSLYFGERTKLAATLYAPRAELVNQAPLELFGAALVRRVAATGTLTLHYDRALDEDACAASRCSVDTDCSLGLRCDGARCLP